MLGILCGLLLATDVPAKLAWLDATGDVFDAIVAGGASPQQQQKQPRVRAPSAQHLAAARRAQCPGLGSQLLAAQG